MKDNTLTAQHELFLDYLFNDPDCERSTMLACVAAGYNRDYHRTLIIRLQDEIIARTNTELAMAAPLAVSKLIGAMDEDGKTPKCDLRFKAVESVMDRIGLAKKQQVEVTSTSAIPLFILPEKKAVVIEDIKDANSH